MDTGILLESGTNELELLEFKVAGNYYGINVAKIREILPYQKPTPIPNAYPTIEGIIMPRDKVIAVVNLEKTLGFACEKDEQNREMLIVTEFNQLNTAFHVDAVLGIHRVKWSDIMRPEEIGTAVQCNATGIVKIDEKLIIILDFEKIIEDISPESSLKVSDIDRMGVRERKDAPILIAEDSHFLKELLQNCLKKAGYHDLTIKSNGKEAWDQLMEYKSTENPLSKVKCIITDLEMPLMDGHHLIKLIRDDTVFGQIPIIIFSSLVNEEMKRKGEKLGASEQLSKPQIGELVRTIDKLLGDI